MDRKNKRLFPSAHEDAEAAKIFVKSPQTLSPSCLLAYADGLEK